MPIEFDISTKDGFFELTASGDADFDSIAAMIGALIQAPGWSPGSSALVDYSKVNAGPLTVDEVAALAKLVSDHRARIGNARIAHLVFRNLEYGLVRMWDGYVHGNWDGTAMIFKSRDEAVSWLLAAKA